MCLFTSNSGARDPKPLSHDLYVMAMPIPDISDISFLCFRVRLMFSIIFLTVQHFSPYQVCGTPVSKTDGCGGVLVEAGRGLGPPCGLSLCFLMEPRALRGTPFENHFYRLLFFLSLPRVFFLGHHSTIV